MNVLIVESPGKVKTIKKILGSGWEVLPSVGHICQLAKDGQNNQGFDLTDTEIRCRYEPNGDRGKQVIAKLRSAVRGAGKIYLAPDPDREGEAIAWHLARELGIPEDKALRVTYTQITEQAVKAALAKPRKLDLALINAQRARQVLDRMVGWGTSPLAWLVGGKSAGRVQSASLHLVCARERQIRAFVPVAYWSLWVDYSVAGGAGWRAFYKSSAAGSGDSSTPEEAGSDDAGEGAGEVESTRISSEEEAHRLLALGRSETHQVASVKDERTSKSPPAPFTTSSLQQAASSQLNMTPEHTMEVAQKLYEGIDLPDGPKGLITYMRTDSVELAPEFVEAARAWLEQHDRKNVPQKKTRHRSKEGAQAAHEAIRPAYIELTPDSIRPSLSAEQYQLYDLIWRRALASQCAPALLDKRRILTQSGPLLWEARGFTVASAGYTRYWNNLDADLTLPQLQQGQRLDVAQVAAEKKKTAPPSRFSEAKLIQLMESAGIGRPSTFAPTVKTLKERDYLQVKGKGVIPTELGLNVDAMLTEHLGELVDAEFTAGMEEALDEVSRAERDWQKWLIGWNSSYLEPALARAKQSPKLAEQGSRARSFKRPLEKSKEKCPECSQPLGKVPSQKVPKGYFLKCERCLDTVLFWSARKEQWERPRPKVEHTGSGKTDQAVTPPVLTEYPCPVCKKKTKLEQFHYLKDGQPKSLLRCSNPKAREEENHLLMVFFLSRGCWWSKEYGELPVEQSAGAN